MTKKRRRRAGVCPLVRAKNSTAPLVWSDLTPQGPVDEVIGNGEGRRCRSRHLARRGRPSGVLALPDLEHAKTAVLNSLTSASGERTYDHAIREFVAWYCSEPRLAFNRTVVLRYRIHLEQRKYAPATINLRLAAVRRIAYEAADAGLFSEPEHLGLGAAGWPQTWHPSASVTPENADLATWRFPAGSIATRPLHISWPCGSRPENIQPAGS